MGSKLRILTGEEIEAQVNACAGTWRKRKNLHKRLLKERAELIEFVISQINDELRRCKSSTMTEREMRPLYSFKAKMERKLILV